ncbi:hypothetical protein SKAU_G00283540 [Synaphobranchus kaupii]|uniref:Uncharacterized protein n=1 Tax=Synaphobranchus kaupii TaxID=118154 RepID=A0A9Q1EXI2_SYNKA|nr:hypothetical protein SKAU_G00283540 [Synaphobranchus kaupii]
MAKADAYVHSLRSAAGLELTDPSDIRKRAAQFYAELYEKVVASHLGVRSVRFMQTVLDRWREALTEPEWALLTDYLAGNKSDIASDPFPELSIAPDLNGMEYNGPMLDFGDCEGVGMSTMKEMEGKRAATAGVASVQVAGWRNRTAGEKYGFVEILARTAESSPIYGEWKG